MNGYDLDWKNENCIIRVKNLKECGWSCFGSWDKERNRVGD